MPCFSCRYTVLLFVLMVARCAHADVRVAGIFNDHMVLQRKQPVQVWGWADQDAVVQVTFADHIVETVAVEGAWSVTLPAMEAMSTGNDLLVSSQGQTITIRDVAVGEVWLASGQSNMAMTVGAMQNELPLVADDIAAADLPSLRFCRINDGESLQPLDDLRQRATWVTCSPTTASNFSGVAFYFALRLHRDLNVPIGIIDSSRGGTPIEPFIPRPAFASHPTLQKELELGDREDLEGIWKLPGGVRARDTNWLPGRLFHSRLAPIARFAVRGAIWYQGESNCGVGEDPRDYEHKQRALIEGWRQAWGAPDRPVYVVQLPGSGAGANWPYLREQQRLASNHPHSGMVVTIDIPGAGIHPPNKIDVGDRLARWALANDYQQKIPFSGPLFDRQVIEDDRIVIHFQHAEHGLMKATKAGLLPPQETPEAELAEFELLDERGNWHPARALIVKSTVVVSNPDVSSPIAVRYAYSVTPQHPNLYNREGLPAAPFCSRPELLTCEPGIPQ